MGVTESPPPKKTPGILEGQGEERETLLATLGAGVGLADTPTVPRRPHKPSTRSLMQFSG